MNGLKQLFAIGLMLFMSACGGGSGNNGETQGSLSSSACEPPSCAEDKHFKVISEGQNGSYTDNRSFMVVESPDAFERFWYDNGEQNTLPVVDFDQLMVVAAFNGQTSSSGHRVDIVAIEDYQNERIIEIVLTSPINDDSCSHAAVVTRPYQVITMERSDKAIQFRSYQEESSSCD